jgi:hypothetical protein
MQTTMRNKTKYAMTCGAILLAAGVCAAQSDDAKSAADQPKYFHLDFVVKELDAGKVINARHYSTTAAVGQKGVIRTGNKVPVQTGSATGITYIDVGVNIDCTVEKETEGNLRLNVSVEISSAANGSNPPLIRQTKWSSNVIVPVGKPTLVFSSDDIASKGQTQLELTATPILPH